jgi:hypothetical protein
MAREEETMILPVDADPDRPATGLRVKTNVKAGIVMWHTPGW